MEPKDLAKVWTTMGAKKTSLIRRCEEYAAWTVPSICPVAGTNDSDDQTKGNVPSGARLVTNLANKVVSAMFPSDRPFFTLPLQPAALRKLRQEFQDEAELGAKLIQIKKATAEIERDAMRDLNLTAYRPLAIESVMNAIVTGNVIIRRLNSNADVGGKERVVYGIKDFCVARSMAGRLNKVILHDQKMFGDLDTADQAMLNKARATMYKDEEPVDVYTYYWRMRNTWYTIQGLDNVMLPDTRTTFTLKKFPLIDLTWSLARNEDYGRGLVEEHCVLFHNVDVTVSAIIDLIAIAADIKHLVHPSSALDVDELNESARGTFHLGVDGDLTTPKFERNMELQTIQGQVTMWERELAQVFLLSSTAVRDAERVTAEEIRMFARELESAFGGLYSRLALSWQQREADYLMSNISLKGFGIKHFDVVIATGLESLSREGQMDALRLAVGDLQLLDTVPDDILAVLDKRKFAEFIFLNRGVHLGQFILSQEQIAANQQAEQQAQQQQMNAQAGANVAEAAGVSAAQGENNG